MLKKRIIAAVIAKDGVVVQSNQFKTYLPVGKIDVTLEFLDSWGIDEIVLLDISATKNGSSLVLDQLQEIVRNCFVPLTYGGGLRNISMVHKAFEKGADKVCFNSAFFNNQELISMVTEEFGKQSVVLSLDFIEEKDNSFLYNYQTGCSTNTTLQDAITKAEKMGVGEILINCVNRDGMYNGFAYETVKLLNNLSVPLIITGGARKASHFADCLNLKQVSAMAAGNMFHFVEHSVTKLKAQLKNKLIRKNLEFNYENHVIQEDQRIQKLSDSSLNEFLYEKLIDRDIC